MKLLASTDTETFGTIVNEATPTRAPVQLAM
jgi:hypothetical protein